MKTGFELFKTQQKSIILGRKDSLILAEMLYLEEELETPIAMVSTGPERKKLIVRDASVLA